MGESGALWQRLRPVPRPADRFAAQARLADLSSATGFDQDACHLDAPQIRALLLALADQAPFLWRLIVDDPPAFQAILDDPPENRLRAVLTALETSPEESEADLMRRLRLARQDLALLIALADLGGVWSLHHVMEALSEAAEVYVRVALRHLLRRAHDAGRLRLADRQDPEVGCGLAVLALGKLGGRELNYSSDIDIVAVFDPASPSIINRETCKALFVRIVQDLVTLLQQPTANGSVLRVDLRLRPDPGATAVAISIESAFLYYESVGQNWERAALIKARAVAGDLAVGRGFLQDLSPFVWRRYFDYAAIADIHAMKRQIHAAKGHADIAVAGHNVKLGRGGIREIEFFVQTQQLIFGGKRKELRGTQTLPMLRALRHDGWIGTRAVADLARAYTFLRRIEHRLQMLMDEQTHTLPRGEALERFARFCGFANASRFATVLTRHLRAVVRHYTLLFEAAPSLDVAAGSLVFTGVENDPETIETLAALGYKAPQAVARMIRDWHAGSRPGLRSARAREALTDLVPKLLTSFAAGSDPDGALSVFDQALARTPAAAELFAILRASAPLRGLFADIMGSAPRLAAAVTLRPHLLDGAIDPDKNICIDETQMMARAAQVLARSSTTEDFLDAIRDFHHEEHFLIGVALLSGSLTPESAGRAYAALAVGILHAILDELRTSFRKDHGAILGGSVAIVAMGKLGSFEMTATSDLDLILLYKFDPEHPESDGDRPLHASRYYTRMTQRLVAHLTAATRRGRLYEVDMRLRPSGRQGPLATQLSAFQAYQRDEAATWERMALTRARVVAGHESFRGEVTTALLSLLRQPPSASLAHDVLSMRFLIEREKPPRDEWDLKLVPGGLIDLEFIAQYIVLRDGAAFLDLMGLTTGEVLGLARRLRLLPEEAEPLVAAYHLYTAVTQVGRVALDDGQTPDVAGDAVRRRIAAAAHMPDFTWLSAEVTRSRQAVREICLALFSGV